MSYTPATDFLALLRTMPDGTVRLSSMPGVDWLLAGLARAGLVTLWTDPANAPTANQATTVWLKVSSTSWAAEAAVLLWDTNAGAYSVATPALWSTLLRAVTFTTKEVDPTGDTVLTAAQAGQLFTNNSAAIITYTLPRAAINPGAEFEFAVSQLGSLNVLPAGSGGAGADTIRWGISASAVSARSTAIGSYLRLRSIGGLWLTVSGEGTWVLS
jgi:hypothetical protein